MRKLVLIHKQALGDVVMLTAVRDLHLNYPGEFETDVRCFFPELWVNNPYLSRVKFLGDGSENDKPEKICVDVVNNLPRCLDMITAEKVIERVESYFEGGSIKYLTN